MKQYYTIILLATTLFLAGCSKDFLKRYEDRIDSGEWRIVDIDRRGPGSSRPLPVQLNDRFVFSEDGSMVFTRNTGEVYDGTWDINRRWLRNGCYTNEYGARDCDGRRVKNLHLTGVDFTSQDFFSIYFDEMVFTGTNRFKAFIYDGWKTYIVRFRR